MHIFWDNSNIYYSGLNQIQPKREPGESGFRVHFANLLQLVSADRHVDKVYMAGSRPPESDSVWSAFRRLGIEPEILPRSETEGEANTTDYLLQTHLLRLNYDVETPGTFALLTGDGAGRNQNVGFFSDAKRLVKEGWSFELYAWDSSCNKEMKAFAEAHGKYVNLEDFYYNITYLEGHRAPKPLNM